MTSHTCRQAVNPVAVVAAAAVTAEAAIVVPTVGAGVAGALSGNGTGGATTDRRN